VLVDFVESAVNLVEATGNVIELAVDLLEAAVDLGELPPKELDQLFVLAWGHGPMTIPGGGPAQVYPVGRRSRAERTTWMRKERDHRVEM
jgi:hypothetical protein